ncbi:MAG: hypothetical protein U0163_19305 [Gemmatimonadaceae bacterium]
MPAEPVHAYDGFSALFKVRDTTGIVAVVVRVTGPFSYVDSVPIHGRPVAVDMGNQVSPPRPLALGIPVTVQLKAYNTRGGAAKTSVSFVAYDRNPPTVSLQSPAVQRDTSVNVGDVLNFTVQAADDDRLAWFGIQEYGLDDTRDSISVDAPTASHVFTHPVTPAWLLRRPRIVAWAKDRSGSTRTGDPQDIRLFHWVARPSAMFPLATSVGSMVYDRKRRLVYVSLPDFILSLDGSLSAVRAFDPVARVFLPDLLKGVRATDLDLSASGDSLFVALPTRQAIGIIDLVSPTHHMTEIPASIAAAPQLAPTQLRSDDAGRVLATMMPGTGNGRLAAIDLRSGALSVVATGSPDTTLPPTVLLATPNHRTVYLLARTLVGVDGYIWRNGSLSAFRSVSDGPWIQSTISGDGTLIMSAGTLLDTELRPIRTLHPPDFGFYFQPNVLSEAGSEAFFGTYYGYARLNTANGSLIEQVQLPAEPRLCIVALDGALLLCGAQHIVGSTVYDVLELVDLL